MIRVEEHLGTRALADLEGPWQALHSSAASTPFLSHPWVSAWHRHLGSNLRPRIVTAWEGETLVGLLPLGQERLLPAGLPFTARRLAFLGEKVGGADYLDVLAQAGREVEVTEILLAHLGRDATFDLLDLYEVAADSPLLPAAHRHLALGKGMGQEIVPRYLCPMVELSGTWEQTLAASRRASNFRRRRRQAEAMGASYQVATTPEEVGPAFERFLELHQRRWSGQGGSDGIGTPALVAFHREVVGPLAAAGALRFEELWIDGACRASIYGLEAGETYYFYQSGFDPEWGSKSVGLVLLGMSMEQAIARGRKVYDFLHGAETYKMDWATRSRQTVALRLVEKGAGPVFLRAGEGAVRAARAWAHALLPAETIEGLRKLRRERRSGVKGERWRRGIEPDGA